MPTVADLQKRLQLDEFFPYQLDCFELWDTALRGVDRLCLYYRTGAGKSITALSCVALRGAQAAVVVAPPITHPDWIALGVQLGVEVRPVSHAKFRMADYQVSRTVPLIVDEFHLLGGHDGKGWAKMDRLARGLKAPLIVCSATPNYNDADRVYCIQHVLDPRHPDLHGGFLAFLYRVCLTEENPFARMPNVIGFQRFKDAEEYLRSLPYVVHVPDLYQANLVDIQLHESVPAEFETYGLNRRTHRIMASQMETRHQRIRHNMLDDHGRLRQDVWDELEYLVGQAPTPVLIFANSSTIAEAVADACARRAVHHSCITGQTSAKLKTLAIEAFRAGRLDVLIGTATLATGTDGLDKICDTLIIADDTDDPSLRKQLMGRILPRGADSDASGKLFWRLVF